MATHVPHESMNLDKDEPISSAKGSTAMSFCGICKQPLNTGSVASRDCGGDCLKCMAECGDPDCIAALLNSLSKREHEVYLKLVKGDRIKSIAIDLGLSIKTVSTYKTRILEKLELSAHMSIERFAANIAQPVAPTKGVPIHSPQLQVYVVLGIVRYEFTKLEGIFLSSEAAETYSKTLPKGQYDDIEIEVHDVHGAKGWV